MKKSRQMKIFFMLLAAVVSMALASCSKDEDKGPWLPVENLEMPKSDAQNPLTEGETVLIKGTGFTEKSELWIVPLSSASSAAATQLKPVTLTAAGLSFVVPALEGQYGVSLKQDGGVYALGNVTFAKKPVLPITGLELPESTQDNPLVGGETVTIKGKGFTSKSVIGFMELPQEVKSAGAGNFIEAEITGVTSAGISFKVPVLDGRYEVLLLQDGHSFTLGEAFFAKEAAMTTADLAGTWESTRDYWDLEQGGYFYLLVDDDYVYDDNEKPVTVSPAVYCREFADAYAAYPGYQITPEQVGTNDYSDNSFVDFEFSETLTMHWGFRGSIPFTATNINQATYSYDSKTKMLAIEEDGTEIQCRILKFTGNELVLDLYFIYPFTVLSFDKTKEYYGKVHTIYTCVKK